MEDEVGEGRGRKQLRLTAMATNNLLQDQIRLAHQDQRQSVFSKHPRLRAILRRLTRALLKWMGDFHRVNLLCDFSASSKSAGKSTSFRSRLVSRTSRRCSGKQWPYAILVLHIISVLMLPVNLYYQYEYDASKIKLQTLNRWLITHNKSEPVDQLVDELQHRAQEARRALRSLGTTYLEWPFIFQCVTIFFLPQSILYMIFIPGVYQLSTVVLLAPGILLDSANESRITAQLVRLVLKQLIAQSEMFIWSKRYISAEFLSIKSCPTNGNDRLSQMMRNRIMVELDERLTRQHEATIVRLQRLASKGRFNPLNRSPDSIDKLALACMVNMAGSGFFFILFMLYAYYFMVIANSGSSSVELNSAMNLIYGLNLLTMVAINYISALYSIALLTLMVLEQITAFEQLDKLLASVVEKNDLRFVRLMSRLSQQDLSEPTHWSATADFDDNPNQTEPNPYVSEFGEQIEADLLTVFVQCRVAARKFELAKWPMNFIALLFSYYALLMPIIFGLHSPYFNQVLKHATLSLAIASGTVCLIFITPLAFLHYRCVKIFRSMWSLAAQLSRFELVPAIKRDQVISMSVASFTFRRELSDSRQTMAKFACRLLWLPITYANLLRIIVWVLVISISLVEYSVGGRLGGRIANYLNDPFGLLSVP
jgi:hypothetical protein